MKCVEAYSRLNKQAIYSMANAGSSQPSIKTTPKTPPSPCISKAQTDYKAPRKKLTNHIRPRCLGKKHSESRGFDQLGNTLLETNIV